MIHSARTGNIVKILEAYSEYAVTKVAFNPSETVLYALIEFLFFKLFKSIVNLA